MTEQTPPQVAEQAALPDALPLHELALIGIFTRPDGNSALLRTAKGEILSLATGETGAGFHVTAIDDTTVIVVDAMRRTHALTMPG